jgi:hypothetical protein
MSTAVDDFLISIKFEKVTPRDDSYYFYKIVDDKEYLIFTFKDYNEIFIKTKDNKAQILKLFDHEIEPYLHALKRKEIIKRLLNE